jgi:hypothetical protein
MAGAAQRTGHPALRGYLTLICSYTGTLNWFSATSVIRSE